MAEKTNCWYVHIEHRRLVTSWRDIGKSEGLETDNQIAKFLINLYHQATNQDSERNFWCIRCKRSSLQLSAHQKPPQEPHRDEDANLKCDASNPVDNEEEADLSVPELSTATTSTSLVIKREVDSASNLSVKCDGSDTIDTDRKSDLLVSEQATGAISPSVPVVKHEDDDEDSASNLSDEICELDVTFGHESTQNQNEKQYDNSSVTVTEENCVHRQDTHTDRDKKEESKARDSTDVQILETLDRNCQVKACPIEESSDSKTNTRKGQTPANPSKENSHSDKLRKRPKGSRGAEKNDSNTVGSKKKNMSMKKKQSKSIVCSVCNATFTVSKSLKSHMLIHTGEKPFPCPHCGVRFRQKSSMIGHVKQVHSTERPFKCPHCSRDFKLNKNLKEHIRCHQRGPLKRPYKRKESPAHDEGNTAKKSRFKVSKSTEGAISADGDNSEGITQQIRGNAAEISSSKDPFSTPSDKSACPVLRIMPEANNADASSGDWDTPEHVDSDKKNMSVKKKQPVSAVCTVCNATFTTRQSLKSHMLIHTGEKPFPCPHCDASFRQRSSMKGHVKHVHSTERPFQCPQCPKDFKDNRHLRKHLKCHQPGPLIKPYKCEECPASFTVKSNLNRHLLIHKGEKPFQCKHCGQYYSQAANLKTHIESQHLKNYRFFCEICGKGLFFYNELQKHTALHKERGKEDGLYMCETCGKAFEKLSSLANHKRAHSKKKKCV